MRRTFNRLSLLAATGLVALCACATPVQAGRLVEVTVVNRDSGERLPTYRHGGRLYVAGTPGERYAVEVANRSGERVLTVISVDGVNVLTGQTAATLQSGYVLDAWRNYAINGWRKSMDDVAQFVFTALPDSYAARTGRPDNVGVIGIAVFRERRPAAPALGENALPSGRGSDAAKAGSVGRAAAQPAAPAAKSESANAARDRRAIADTTGSAESSAAPAEQPQRLGTGHGEREHSPTRSTEFVRAGDTPDEVLSIHYDSRPNLVARGIIRSPRVIEPRPFPGGIGFVPDPRG